MRLGSYINSLPDWREITNIKELKEFKPFSSKVSNSLFLENKWEFNYSPNEQENFVFDIKNLKVHPLLRNFWKILFLEVCSKKRYFLTTARMEFYHIKSFIAFILEHHDRQPYNQESFFNRAIILEYVQHVENSPDTRDHKYRKIGVIQHWIEYSCCLPKNMEIPFRQEERQEWLKSIEFSETIVDQKEYRGFQPLSFPDYERLIVGSLWFLHRYSQRILNILQSENRAKETSEFYSTNPIFQNNRLHCSYPQTLYYLLNLLQGASITLLLCLCPMRCKELRDLKENCLIRGDQYSNIEVNIEKFGDGPRLMPIPNLALIALDVLQKIKDALDQHNTPFLLVGTNCIKKGASITSVTIGKRLKNFALFIGVEDIPTAHRFRSTCARAFMFLNQISGIELFQELVGHKEIKMTQDHYAKLGKQERIMIGHHIYIQQLKKLSLLSEEKYSPEVAISHITNKGHHYRGRMFDMCLSGDENFIGGLELENKNGDLKPQEKIDQITQLRRIG